MRRMSRACHQPTHRRWAKPHSEVELGMLRTMGKRLALRVSSLVAGHELFERAGERSVQPPLEPGAWEGLASPSAEAMPTVAAAARLLTAAPIKHEISQGPAIVHHWATWCESCMTETAALKALAARTGVPLVGVSWDTFQTPSPEAALTAVQAAVSAEEMDWKQLVVKGGSAHFFKVMGIQTKTVPQTWLVDAKGEVHLRIEGPIDMSSLDDLVEKVNAL
jgi:thiol-disulfide isomerase/thioredoxin